MSRNITSRVFDRLLNFIGIDTQQVASEEKIVYDVLERVQNKRRARMQRASDEMLEYGVQPNNQVNWEYTDSVGIFSFTRENLDQINFTMRGNYIQAISFPPINLSETNIRILTLSDNQIKQDVSIFHALIHLELLYITRNKFTGHVDTLIKRLPNLKVLDADQNHLRFENHRIDLSKQTSLVQLNLNNNGLLPASDIKLPKSIRMVNFMDNPDFLKAIDEVWVFENLVELKENQKVSLNQQQSTLYDSIEEAARTNNNIDATTLNMLKKNTDALSPRRSIAYNRQPTLSALYLENTGFASNLIRCELFDTIQRNNRVKDIYDQYPVKFVNIENDNCLTGTVVKDLDLMNLYGRINQRDINNPFWFPIRNLVPETEMLTCGVYFKRGKP